MQQTMSYRRILLLTAAMALSLATAMIVRAWVDEARHSVTQSSGVEETAKPVPKKILVAAHTLPAGQFVKEDDMQWQEWPIDSINSNYILEGTRPLDTVIGSVVRAGIGAGEPVLDDRLIKKGDRGFLSAVMTAGTRAVTVQLQQNAGLGGLVVPGDHVDVLLTAIIPGSQGEPEHRATQTVLNDIRIIAIDQKMSDTATENVMARSATLEVTPKQAEILALVTDMGKLSLTLRSIAATEEQVPVNAKGEPAKPSVTWDADATNLGLMRHVPQAQRTDSGEAKVDIVRGSEQKSVAFPKGDK
jgi:pilus assembly protein CpaB